MYCLFYLAKEKKKRILSKGQTKKRLRFPFFNVGNRASQFSKEPLGVLIPPFQLPHEDFGLFAGYSPFRSYHAFMRMAEATNPQQLPDVPSDRASQTGH